MTSKSTQSDTFDFDRHQSDTLGNPKVTPPSARYRRPIETNQGAASSAWPRRGCRYALFCSNPSTNANFNTDLPLSP